MTAEERRQYIIDKFTSSDEIISANTFAKELDVSRQIIVGDIALLRALGYNISSTPKGYLLEEDSKPNGVTKVIRSKHSIENMVEELYTVVFNGGAVLDVQIEHELYGKLIGTTNLYSKYDVDKFVEKVKENNVAMLSGLTDGEHEHTIWASDEDIMDRIVKELQEKGLIH